MTKQNQTIAGLIAQRGWTPGGNPSPTGRVDILEATLLLAQNPRAGTSSGGIPQTGISPEELGPEALQTLLEKDTTTGRMLDALLATQPEPPGPITEDPELTWEFQLMDEALRLTELSRRLNEQQTLEWARDADHYLEVRAEAQREWEQAIRITQGDSRAAREILDQKNREPNGKPR